MTLRYIAPAIAYVILFAAFVWPLLRCAAKPVPKRSRVLKFRS